MNSMCAQEAHVVHTTRLGFGSAMPHTRPFDIDADEVLGGKAFSKSDTIFTASAAQFQYYGIVVAEEGFVPLSEERMAGRIRGHRRRLHHVGVSRHIGKFGEFVLTHASGCD